jgi:hypothetical protein
MPKRIPLRRQLTTAWRDTLAGPYRNQQINSERGLQVHFCLALMKQFEIDGLNRLLFVEPTVTFGPSDMRCPDLVICNSQQIIGIVEFKYAPRTLPEYSKDLETLHRFIWHANGVTLSNERFRGEGMPKTYSLAEDAVLCWAAVYADTFFEMQHSCLPALEAQFLRLDAITHESAPPVIRNSMDWQYDT